MSLTHYWLRPPNLLPEEFTPAAEDCRRIMPHLGIPLASWDGPAVFTPEIISFNGVQLQRCEFFTVRQKERLERGKLRFFSFTKTDWLPYDRCVRVALIILRHHLGNDLEVTSDDQAATYWDQARNFCQQHLGYGSDVRFSK